MKVELLLHTRGPLHMAPLNVRPACSLLGWGPIFPRCRESSEICPSWAYMLQRVATKAFKMARLQVLQGFTRRKQRRFCVGVCVHTERILVVFCGTFCNVARLKTLQDGIYY